MKRRVALILLLLLGGAIVNIAVAWGITIFAGAIPIREGSYDAMSLEAAKEYWLRHAPVDWHDIEIAEEAP